MTSRKEIAELIAAHLKRFEDDPVINASRPELASTRPYWRTNCRIGGKWIYVQYVVYQGERRLTTAEAREYLAWLWAGNVGTHYKMKTEKAQ